MKINEVIIKPVLTEKATNQTKGKTYMFEVAMKANKYQIKATLEKLYSVSIDEVRMMIRKGKERHVGKRMKSRKLPDTKVAYVVVKEGTIDLFPKT